MALDVVIYCSLLLVPESAVCTFKEVVIFIEYFSHSKKLTIIQSLVVFKIGYFEIMVVIRYDVHKSKLSIIKINKLLFIYSGFLEQQNIEFIEKKKNLKAHYVK